MKTILLSDFIDHIPEHARIGVVEKYYSKGNEYNHAIYTGHKKDFIKLMNLEDRSLCNFEVNYCYAGSWDNLLGLIINVTDVGKRGNYEKR